MRLDNSDEFAGRDPNEPTVFGGSLECVPQVRTWRAVIGGAAASLLVLAGVVDLTCSSEKEPGVIGTAINFKEGLFGDTDLIIQEEAAAAGIDVNLLRAVIWTESSFNPYAESHADCHGLMQLNRDFFTLSNPNDPRENVHTGAIELARLLRAYPTDIALACYNAGEGNVLKKGGEIPDFPETQNYVKRVLARKALLDNLM